MSNGKKNKKKKQKKKQKKKNNFLEANVMNISWSFSFIPLTASEKSFFHKFNGLPWLSGLDKIHM